MTIKVPYKGADVFCRRFSRRAVLVFGMVMTGIEPLEGILTADEAELLSCSLQYQCIDDDNMIGGSCTC